MFTLVHGDATCPDVKGNKIIAHVCNDIGVFGAGFALAVAMKWPDARQVYIDKHRCLLQAGSMLKLGDVIYYDHAPDLCIAHMISQAGVCSRTNPVPLKYDALEECLADVNKRAECKEASVHMPKIGAGLAGGDWNRIQELINKHITVPCFVYVLI